jgi:uridine kinase
MIDAPPAYLELLAQTTAMLGPYRDPLLIGFDGRDGHGKTSAATWLAWQLGMPAVHLDLFLRDESEGPIGWHTDDLSRCLKNRGDRPIIVEGVLLLDALEVVYRTADFLVFVEKLEPERARDRTLDDDLIDMRQFSVRNQISRYFDRRNIPSHSQFTLAWRDSSV